MYNNITAHKNNDMRVKCQEIKTDTFDQKLAVTGYMLQPGVKLYTYVSCIYQLKLVLHQLTTFLFLI